jgi:hypothetical protein
MQSQLFFLGASPKPARSDNARLRFIGLGWIVRGCTKEKFRRLRGQRRHTRNMESCLAEMEM